MRYSLSIGKINGIDLYIAGIKMHFYHLILHINQKHSNILKSVLYIKKLTIG